MISEPMGQMWLWTSLADELHGDDPDYFANFWTKPGYVGHDAPDLGETDLIHQTGRVVRTLSARNLNESPDFAGPEFQTMRILAAIVGAGGEAYDFPYAVEIEGLTGGYRVGTGVQILTGKATGRSLYATGAAGDVFACDGQGDANVLRFKGVEPGDEVLVDNRRFLAYCYFARHHVTNDPAFAHLLVDGRPIHPQHPVPRMSSLMGVCYSGQYEGKVLWLHHTHDSSVWPAWGTLYDRAVRQAQGEAGARANFRIRWTEYAEHGPYTMVPPEPNRVAATRLVDFRGITDAVDDRPDRLGGERRRAERHPPHLRRRPGAPAVERGRARRHPAGRAGHGERRVPGRRRRGRAGHPDGHRRRPAGHRQDYLDRMGLRRHRHLSAAPRRDRRHRRRADRLDHARLRPAGNLLRHRARDLPPHRRRARATVSDRDDRPGPHRRHRGRRQFRGRCRGGGLTMAGSLDGKVVLITGTGSGMGRAGALRFAAAGATVVGCDLNAEGNAETEALVKAAAGVKAAGGQMFGTAPVDLGDYAACESWVDAAVRAHGRLDVL